MTASLTLTLLRRGRSRADDEKVCEGRYDSPLTEVGERQVAKPAGYWQEHPPEFERVVCSSLIRARRTAEVTGQALRLEVTPSDAWCEFDNGPAAGLPYAEAKQRYPEPAFRHRFKRFTGDGGEFYAASSRWISGALEMLFWSALTNVLVVAHEGCLNVALRELLQAPPQTSFAFGDASFAKVVVPRQSNQVRLLSLNRTPHLR